MLFQQFKKVVAKEKRACPKNFSGAFPPNPQELHAFVASWRPSNLKNASTGLSINKRDRKGGQREQEESKQKDKRKESETWSKSRFYVNVMARLSNLIVN